MAAHLAAQSPAEVYEERFVPALFLQWGEILADTARLAPGERVLDVACGTGVAALAAAARVGSEGAVSGLDANPDMLAVARRKSAHIDWRQGRAEALPFADASFDAVLSQFGLMFFEERARALAEMWRVLRPEGRLVVAVCDALERSAGYAALAALLERLFGRKIADAFRAPFALGEPEALHELCRQAGIAGARVARREGTVRFASIRALVATERACVWTLGGLLDEAQFERLAAEAERALAPFRGAEGAVGFGMPALLISATRPA